MHAARQPCTVRTCAHRSNRMEREHPLSRAFPITSWLASCGPVPRTTLYERTLPAPYGIEPGVCAVRISLQDAALLTEAVPDFLLPDHIARASPTRRISFVAGRICAELSLAQLDIQASVPCGNFGEPIWPTGVTGSITHNGLFACAAAMRQTSPCGLGIDSELIAQGSARDAIRELCLTEHEKSIWADADKDGIHTTILFSAKEALYKATHSVVRRFVDFREVEATELHGSEGGRLTIRPCATSTLASVLPAANCRFVIEDRSVHTWVLFPHDA